MVLFCVIHSKHLQDGAFYQNADSHMRFKFVSDLLIVPSTYTRDKNCMQFGGNVNLHAFTSY